MAYRKGTFINAHGFKQGVKNTVVEHIIGNAGHGSGRVCASPNTAVFVEKGFSVRQGNLGTINRNRLDAPYPAKTAVIVQGFRTAEEIQDIFKAFLENGVADTSSCFAESLL